MLGRGSGGRGEKVRALREAWSPERGAFVSYYTGLELEEGGPWGVAFDERGMGRLVVACELVRRMKRGLAEDELWGVVKEFHRCEKEGRAFDKKIVEFEYWKRKLQYR